MFKAFFSRTGNEKFLKAFLTALLGKELNIKRVIHDARLEQLAKEEKYGILDLDIELDTGEFVNIEMQLANYNNIYVTKTVRVADKHRNYEINNNVTYYYIELDKFRNGNPDMKDPINQWLAFIDMERGDLLDMAEKENKIIKEAKKTYETLTGDAEVKRLAEIRLMSKLEEQAALASARDKGTKYGLELGKKEKQLEIAKKLSKLNVPIDQISIATGLTHEEIKHL